jgi:cell division septal protein FtsQ
MSIINLNNVQKQKINKIIKEINYITNKKIVTYNKYQENNICKLIFYILICLFIGYLIINIIISILTTLFQLK